jgi:hypothetical protein
MVLRSFSLSLVRFSTGQLEPAIVRAGVLAAELLARDLARAIILRGADLSEFREHLLIMTGMGVALFAFCVLRFRQKIG